MKEKNLDEVKADVRVFLDLSDTRCCVWKPRTKSCNSTEVGEI